MELSVGNSENVFINSFLPNLSSQFRSESCSVLSDSLQPYGLYSPWNSPGQNTGVGSLSLLQGIFPTQGSNPGLPHYRQILYQLSHKGNPRILELVAYPFSSRSSQPRNQTRVSALWADSLPGAQYLYIKWSNWIHSLKSISICLHPVWSLGHTGGKQGKFTMKNHQTLIK